MIGASPRRLWGVVRKETLQIARDPSSIAIAFVLPVILLLLFGYGVSLDARRIPVGIVIEQPDLATHALAGSFARSEFFRPVDYRSIHAARDALASRRIDAIVWLRGDFSRHLLAGGEAPVGVFLNGEDSNRANLTAGYIQGVWLAWLARFAERRGRPLAMPVALEPRVWFNPAVSSRMFLVPGIIAIIMTLIGTLLTSMVVAREWERGTMEALMATPLGAGEMLAGKLLPYFALGMGGMLFSVALGRWQFGVPLEGSLAVLAAGSALYMLVVLAIGLLISVVARNQFVAGQVAIMTGFLPAFMLSGFLFDIRSMPDPIQWLTYLIPARYFVAFLQTVFLAGDVWPVIARNLAVLALMLAFFAALVWRRSRRGLD